jgi:DNA modification methylase
MNKLYYGDNLDVLREYVDKDSVDLVYLDPPFNSNRNYNVIFGKRATSDDASAQIEAFDDTWHWTPVTDQQYQRYALAGGLPPQVGDALTAFRTLLGENDAMAYLVNMAPRLVELHRVLKPTGSLYLHCDSTMSHYLKILLDSIFGPERYVNEIIWQRTNARSTSGRWPRVHDVLLFYSTAAKFDFKQQVVPADPSKLPHTLITGADGKKYQTYELTGEGRSGSGVTGKPWRGFDPNRMGRHWGNMPDVMDEWDREGLIHWPKDGGFPRRRAAEPFDESSRTVTVGDVWTDIDRLNQTAKERLGYPTQKPLALLDRILRASSKAGEVVLDPFCGCGTTVDAAQGLGRQWIGIDVTFIAIDLIEKRLQDRYPGIAGTYETFGIPRDAASARALFNRSPFDFERWAVSRINARPNEKQVGDKGIDGVARFYLDKKTTGRVLVSVKGGGNVGPQFVRDLLGAVETQKAQMGILITMAKPTAGMRDAANHGGIYTWPVNGQTFPRIQTITVADLLAGKRPDMPSLLTPYSTAIKAPAQVEQLDMLELEGQANGTE